MNYGLPRVFLAAALALAAVFLPMAGLVSRAQVPVVPSDAGWYRYQGAPDSGPEASINCEVTSVAMAIQYAQNGLRVPISSIREFMGTKDLTSTADAEKALSHWGVSYRGLQSMDDVLAAVGRGHIVILGMMMNRISVGADYMQGKSAPAQRFGRYYPFDGPHSLVVKGVTEGKGWLLVNDPDVWDGNSIYWYSDGTPKGEDRYYPVGEVSRAMADLADSPKGLEILGATPLDGGPGNGAQASYLIQTQSPAAIKIPSPILYPKQSSDLSVLGSLGSSWKSVTFTFRMVNPRGELLQVSQIGVQGRDPRGTEFFASGGPAVLQPGGEMAMAIPMAAGEAGAWRIYRVLYFAEGLWRELPASGFLQQQTFAVR
ncbi:MAG: C39 family peptidase [Dehalococcoidia bacterium]|nr:C39 family peptidase [Dehalococcoidia bacterium]